MLGKLFYEMNRPQESLNAFTNNIKLDPQNVESHYYVGMILRRWDLRQGHHRVRGIRTLEEHLP
jgi:hypothetical protein